ncbi:MAG: molybdopterin-dependent oxidoreductase [Deltaproteobacteria bacterium]|nr:molybdopterin-dependent oxidoreductase [Deltaproteobacteria bacterium]
MEEISLTINGTRMSCPPGTTVLEAAEEHGIPIPKLCHHPDLKPVGACRLCLVEDEKSGRIMASCVTPVAPDMEIRTDSSRVMRHRRNILRLMMAEHPESCLVCSKGNRCQLRELAGQMGLGETGLYPTPNYKAIELANPFIIRDLSKCILCGRCIRADHELVVAGAIDYHMRGFASRPATLYDLPLESSSCTFCGTCVSICPTGALTPRMGGHVGTPEREALTTCGFCGVGCSIRIGVAGQKAVEINPSGLPGSVNAATLCVRGHFAHDFLNSRERLTQPLIRRDNDLTPVSWDEALDYVAGRLLDIKKEDGPQSIGFFGSSKCTNEENYLFQKLARVLVGTNNVDNGGFMAGREALQVVEEKTGGRRRPTRLAHLEKAEIIVVLGADPGHSAPVVAYHLKRAAQKGIPIIGVDPRKTDLFPFSALWLTVVPDKDAELITCLAALMWKTFAHDPGFIERSTEGFGPYSEALSSFNPERLCMASGSEMGALTKAADLLKGKKISFVVGHGITQHRHGVQAMEAVLNLAMMTGSLAREPAGLYLLARENNQVGAWDMGTVPDTLPGRTPLHEDSRRREWERAWGVRISPDQGLNGVRMIEATEKGILRAMVIMGENPVRGLPQQERVAAALKGLDLLVVQDILHTETSRLADVVLPGAPFSEKGGSFTNMEGRISCFTPVVPPPGDARPDWEILDRLGVKMGYPKAYGSLDAIRAEIARLIPMYAGLREDSGKAWTWIRETQTRRPFRFSPLPAGDREEMDDDYPLTAILGSQRLHLGSGTRTGRSKRIADFGLNNEVVLSPADGDRLNLHTGDRARVQSRLGALIREVRIDDTLQAGQVFIPTGFHENDAMNLIELTAPGTGSWQGFKTCQVRLETPGVGT